MKQILLEKGRPLSAFTKGSTIDVWNKIKARAAEMDAEDAYLAKQSKAEDKKRKAKSQSEAELAAGITAGAFLLMMLAFGLYELFAFCAVNRCGR